MVSGDLRLFGSEPVAAEQQPSTVEPFWDRRRYEQHAGLLGPAQLDLSPDAPDEELRLNELEFVTRKGLVEVVRRLAKATAVLFSARSWRTMS